MAAELQPHVALYQINLGNVLLKQRLLAEAATAYRQAVKLAPDDANALNNLAWAWHELDANLDEAAALCQRAVTLQPSRRAYYLDTLGCVLRKQGKSAEARGAFESALAAVTARQASLRETIEAHLASVKD
jgi:tetratricopeptide (TPR) repeat protein